MPAKSSSPSNKSSARKPKPGAKPTSGRSGAASKTSAARTGPPPAGARSSRAPKSSTRKARPSFKPLLPRIQRFFRLPSRSSAPRPIRQGLSLDRKLDILGIALALAGLLTFLSLISSNNSSVTGGWVFLLRQAFGIGLYPATLGLMGVGVWLVLRDFDHVPQFAIERVAGFILLLWNLLAWAHLIWIFTFDANALELAAAGQGGGYAGGAVLQLLLAALGFGGAVISLLAWFVIALGMTLDVTIGEMAQRLGPYLNQLLELTREALANLDARLRHQPPPYPEMQPLHRPGGLPEVTAVPLAAPARGPVTDFSPAFTGQLPTWVLPPLEKVLDQGGENNYDDEIDLQRARLIEETLNSFGAPARVIEINRGPTITQFGVEPDFVESRGGRMRVRVGKITALADDLALALSARTIRIQAPVPGKGFVGIEVPNDEIALVALRDLIENEAFKRLKSPLRFALGLNVSGNAVAADLAAMPHLLIAGATGSGKSVCVNALICCLLVNNTPDDLRLIMVDPKRVELTGYNGIPHLLAPVVVELERVISALQWVTREMDLRYQKLAEAGCRNIQDFNARQVVRGDKKLPYLVVIIDELADLMMLAPDDTERTITRLAQLARATGIHLVIATQRPSVDVVTGLIKANFPARVAFAVASNVDSRVILDQPGAERLLGRGDMLFQAPDAPAPVRLQGVFVADSEIQRLVDYWRSLAGYVTPSNSSIAGGIVDALPPGVPLKQMPMWEEMTAEEKGDPLLPEAIDEVRRKGRASTSMLQTRFRIGYTRASRIIDTMEAKGIIGPPEPTTGAREILDYGQAAPPVDD